MPAASAKSAPIDYARSRGVDAFVDRVAEATPMQLFEAELRGIDSRYLKELAARLDIPAVRLFQIVGIPKATAERKAAAHEPVTGAPGQAALGLTRLLALAKQIVADSTAAGAKDFDEARWLGRWLDLPQPALGGRKPGDLLATPTGLEMVTRLLGALESGAYQ